MKISIVTVNFNGNRFLQETIDSILSQNFEDIELLLIDGGSTDGSLATITAAASRDKRIKWLSEPDRGIADAMNKGISLASGDIIGVLHSDDRYPHRDVLSSVDAAFTENPAAVWLTGGITLISQVGRPFRDIPVRKYSYDRLVRSNILFHPATFVRTCILRDCRMFNEDLQLAMDYDLWLRLGELGDPFVLESTLACFRVHDESRSLLRADEALVEEFNIRRRFLITRGRNPLPYYFDYLAKRVVNRFFIWRLRRDCSGR